VKNKCFSYVKIDKQNNCVITSGISWEEFYCGIGHKPENLLLLAGYPYECEASAALNLSYIPKAQMEAFAHARVYDYGDFAWVDFQDAADLSAVLMLLCVK